MLGLIIISLIVAVSIAAVPYYFYLHNLGVDHGFSPKYTEWKIEWSSLYGTYRTYQRTKWTPWMYVDFGHDSVYFDGQCDKLEMAFIKWGMYYTKDCFKRKRNGGVKQCIYSIA